MSYPLEIDDEQLAKFDRISSDEIRRDIADTESEVILFNNLASAQLAIANHRTTHEKNSKEYRRRAERNTATNIQRTEFIGFLRRILSARDAKSARNNTVQE